MGKRSDGFKRSKNDFYITPEKPVLSLLPYLKPRTKFNEPCAGSGALIDILQKYGHECIEAWDIEPQREGITAGDARQVKTKFPSRIDCFITNPPWTREILHDIIKNLSPQKPTWLLFDADWMHNKHAREHLKYCEKIISVGRVKWFEDSKSVGKDNAAWYLFNNRLYTNLELYNPILIKKTETVFINGRI